MDISKCTHLLFGVRSKQIYSYVGVWQALKHAYSKLIRYMYF